ncbi:hypothetical protein DSAG12_03389 [Promethearchaeum syntrophicum]|uniref:Class I SAM-dependent methyltransferase n=1 Tax=Promethearchaeum syntrophicum TaxID=2594042 RepID=A0A5B9DEN0_9ARCH|nr:hypothetical protein [Candidatus Prometheoarchaeum syntrophicum]QEE17552.1 hypothetical protein DSAG12_03389 [Candidatus Prometheoarchaeum syntrophicum]
MKDSYNEYLEYEQKMQREGLFEVISQKFEIKKAIYPGSYIHISPSFYFEEVVYIDSDKKAKKFFADNSFEKLINHKKRYSKEICFRFYPTNFKNILPEEEAYFDLLISQYAGFISRECKKYLKIGGILLVNNSHGDAQLAKHDPDYEFIAVINFRNKKFYYSTKNLDEYFIPKKEGLKIDLEYFLSINKGIGFKKSASHYVFRKIR